MFICWGVKNINGAINGMYIFNLILIIFGSIFTLLAFILIVRLMFDGKFRSKVVGKQAKIRKQVLEENEKILKDIENKEADIKEEALTKKTKAIKKGLVDKN